MLTVNEVVEFIHHPLAYEQKLVHAVTPDLLQIQLTSPKDLYSYTDTKTIKIEGMERYNAWVWNKAREFADLYNHTGPITAHAFMTSINGPTFGVHTDPDDVIVYCCEGTKRMEVDGNLFVLNPGDWVYMPHNTPHRAINTDASLMISFGLERFYVDKMVDVQ